MIDQFDILVTENNDDVTVNVTNNLEEVVDIFVSEDGEEIELNITNNIVELNIIRGAVNLSLTTNNNSGAATYDNITGVFNIPNYTLAGLGGQAALNGLGFVKINGTTISYDNSTYLTTINGIAAGGELSGTYPNPTLVNSAVTGKLLSGVNITGGTIQASDSILTAFGKVQNQINGLIGGTIFQGLWNASTNSPSLASSVGSNGHYYIVSVAGSTNLNGITDWNVGDWAIFSGTSWQKVDNTDAVVSVNGFTGAVSLTTSNITEGTNLYYTNARARAAISLTTTGTSGAATYNSTTGVFNIPQYAPDLSGFVPYTGATANVNLGTHTLLAKDLVINHSSGSGVAASITKNGSGEALTVVKGSGSGNAASITGGITLLTTLNLTNALADSFIASAATWNAKQNAITLTTTGTSGAATLVGATLNIPQYADQFVGTVTSVGLTSSTSGVTIGSSPITTSGNITLAIATASGSQQGLLSSTDWTTFNNKQNALTNPITGSGTTNFLPKFTGASTLGNSAIQDNTSSIVYTFSSNPVLNITDGTRSSFFGTATTAGAYVNASQVGDAFIRANNGIVFSGANGTGGELRLDASGNLGLGVTPSAWFAESKVLQFDGGAVLEGRTNLTNYVSLSANSRINFSGNFIYLNSTSASRYQQFDGVHSWYNAPSGTAGNAISFTQAMTLGANGNLLLGTTSDNGARLQVQGSGTFSGSLNAGIFNQDTPVYFSTNNTANSPALSIFKNTSSSTEDVFRVNSFIGAVVTVAKITATGAATFSSSVTAGSFISNGQVSLYDYVNVQNNFPNFTQLSGIRGKAYYQTNYPSSILMGDPTASNNNIMTFNVSNGDVTGTEKMRITGDGNVGIGTTNPNQPLSIQANSSAASLGLYGRSSDNTSTVRFFQNNGTTRLMEIGISPSAAEFYYDANAPMIFSTNASERMRITAGGNVGINCGGLNAKLEVVATSGEAFRADVSGGAYRIIANQSGVLLNGNVGIGTTSPQANLDIQGSGAANLNLKNTTGGTDLKNVRLRNLGNVFYIEGINDAYSAITNQFTFDIQNGRLGIGTTSPSERLHVVGNIKVTSGGIDVDDATSIIRANNTRIAGTDRKIQVWNNVSAYIDVLTMAATGAATFSNSVTATAFFASSDIRLKDIIAHDGDMITYKWKDGRDDKIHYGYSAQNLQSINPNLVNKNDDGFLSVNYTETLVLKVRELEKEVQLLKAQIN
jgi:hypothetical protein